jgi:hypothetical protein
MRATEATNELRDFSFAIVIASPVTLYVLIVQRTGSAVAAKMADPVSLAQLLVLTALGYIFHSIEK